MTVRTRVAAVGVLAGLLLAVAPFVVLRPADAAPAQTVPEIPVEDLVTILEPLQPVLEVISPIAWPACANAVLVSVLPGAVGLDLPPELSTVLGPLLVLCGSVPEPTTNRRVCVLDAQAQALLAEVSKPLTGSALPIEVAPVKWLTGLLDNIVDLVDLPGVPLGSSVAAVLQCTDPPPDPETILTDPPAEDTVPTVAVPEVSFVDPPTFGELQSLPPLAVEPVARPTVPVVDEPVVQIITQPKFRYPVVMALPLLFVGLLTFFGRTLTRPLVVGGGAASSRRGGDR